MDKEKFIQTIVPLREKLSVYASRYLADREDIEDAVQETFIRLWNVRDKLSFYLSKEALAKTILKNICLDKLRERKYQFSPLDTVRELQDKEEDPYQLLETRNKVELVKLIISTLPSLQQMVIRMKDIEGYEVDEIAEIMDCKETAVMVTLSRARKRVREEYMKINERKYRQ